MKKFLIFCIATFFILGCQDEKQNDQISDENLPKKEEIKVEQTSQISQKTEPIAEFDAKYTYNVKCKVCHGIDAKTKALNKSQILAELSENEIILSLIGYQNGTYGGTLKATMIPMVKNLSEENIKDLAKFIKTLK